MEATYINEAKLDDDKEDDDEENDEFFKEKIETQIKRPVEVLKQLATKGLFDDDDEDDEFDGQQLFSFASKKTVEKKSETNE